MPIFLHHCLAHFEKVKELSKRKYLCFLLILNNTTVRLLEKGLLFPRKVVCGGNLPYFEVNEIYK